MIVVLCEIRENDTLTTLPRYYFLEKRKSQISKNQFIII